jgi:hypothetical protein
MENYAILSGDFLAKIDSVEVVKIKEIFLIILPLIFALFMKDFFCVLKMLKR